MVVGIAMKRRLLCVAAALAFGPAAAGESAAIDPGRDALLIHGNFCGPGNRGPQAMPIDALDRACMRHDACSPLRGEIASCACNRRLHREAQRVADDPRRSESLRGTGGMVADIALLLPCR